MTDFTVMVTTMEGDGVKKSLSALREERGLTQVQVAKRLGITAAAYCRKEKGVRPLYASELKRLAELFQVSLDEIDFSAPDLAELETEEMAAPIGREKSPAASTRGCGRGER